MSSKQGGYIRQLLSNIFTKDSNSTLAQLTDAIGSQLDLVDPAQTNLELQFSVSTATGAQLDAYGVDYKVSRRLGEADADYRARILAKIPVYANGPTVSAISSIVQAFTGTAPIIIEYGPDSFTMGVSPMGSFVFSDGDPFSFEVQVQNPNNVAYKRADLEQAVNDAKPARSSAVFVHQGGI